MSEMVSIIVPAYNAEKTILRCLQSIQQQTYRDFEAIIIDDGSRDNTGILCDHLAAEEKRFKVIHQPNAGVSASRNKGMAISSGKYIMFVDADDEIAADHLMSYVNAIGNKDADIVLGGLTIVDTSGKTQSLQPGIKNFADAGKFWNAVCKDTETFGYAVNKLFRSAIIKENGCRFQEDFYSQEDLDFCLTVYDHCNSFYLIDKSDYIYYRTEGQRVPAISHYIMNQLKLYCLVNNKKLLTYEAEKAVEVRILTLIHTSLYDADQTKRMDTQINELYGIPGLIEYLYGKNGKGEKYLIAKLLSKKKTKQIKTYYRYRRIIKKILLPIRNKFES